jgi:hypothetical protein
MHCSGFKRNSSTGEYEFLSSWSLYSSLENNDEEERQLNEYIDAYM